MPVVERALSDELAKDAQRRDFVEHPVADR
jgi:hypothetical protein